LVIPAVESCVAVAILDSGVNVEREYPNAISGCLETIVELAVGIDDEVAPPKKASKLSTPGNPISAARRVLSAHFPTIVSSDGQQNSRKPGRVHPDISF
jgi:hypothetical protein